MSANNPFHGKYGPLLIAEIGGNHEGNFAYALELARLAIETDVDYVKFQIYTGDSLVSSMESPERNRHFKKFELTPQQHLQLAQMITGAGIGYMASVWDMDAVQWIDQYMPVYKIGSGDLTAYPVLRQIAAKGKPIILSTGLSLEQEVLDAVSYIQKVNPLYKNKNYLAILQCTSMYPIPAKDAHLHVMQTFRDKTNLSIGYSDHTEGSKALQYAFAMGAEILEFHFTDSREGKQFRDHKVSLTPVEVKELIAEIQLISKYKGSFVKQPLQIELDNGHELSFRRAVYPARDIKAGEILSTENLVLLRPNIGIDARDYDKILGRKILISVQKHQKLSYNMIQ